MIQLNLLPDLKLQYLKAERTKRLVMLAAVLSTGISLGLLLSILSVSGLQKKHLSDLNADIAKESKSLQNKPQIDKVLTVQNQLSRLTELHSAKPAAARLFGYMNQVTPVNIDITSLNVDFAAQTATITGTADSLATVNQYIDTLKFTTYLVEGTDNKKAPAFSDIVLSSFGVGTGNASNQASYSITLLYDKPIFDITQTVKLEIPSKVTTRSEVEQPTDLFKVAPAPTPGGAGN